MSEEEDLYETVDIKDKGIGCVALQDIPVGISILIEKPQIFVEDNFQSLMKDFKKLTFQEKKDFFSLHNLFRRNLIPASLMLKFQKELNWSYENLKVEDRLLFKKVFGIFKSNSLSGILGLKTSRFNHSCYSNAEVIFDTDCHDFKVRTVRKICSGDEITINYLWSEISMKSVRERQTIILNSRGFKCKCENCQTEIAEKSQFFKSFGILQNQIRILDRSLLIPEHFDPGACLVKISIFKRIYAMAMQENVSMNYVLTNILEEGFNSLLKSYVKAKANDRADIMDSIEHEIELLAISATNLHLLLYGKQSYKWQKRQNFKSWSRRKHTIYAEKLGHCVIL